MGGAFTGVANEPSAAYYNPAGLARLEDTSLSAGLTLVALDRYNVEQGYRAEAGSVSLSHDARPSLPLFVSFVKQIGARRDDNLRRHAIAFSTFTPDRRSLGFDVRIDRQQGNTRAVDTLYVQQSYETLWHGVSYAYRFSDEWTFGVSTFLSLTSMSNVEERLALSLLDEAPDGTWGDPEIGTVSRRSSNDVKSFVTRLGVLHVRDRFRFGVMLQPQSVHITGSAKVREREAAVDATGVRATGTYFERSNRSLPAHEPFPWELRLGSSYRPRADLIFAADLSIYTGNRKDVVWLGVRPPEPNSEQPRSAGTFVPARWGRVGTANVSLGTEYTVWDTVVFRGGLFTDLSAAPTLPRTSETYQPSDVHRFGGGCSVGFVGTGFDLSLGVLGRVGVGQAMAYRNNSPDAPYERTSVHEQTLFVFLTGVRRVVSKLADVTVEKLQRLREEDQNQTATPEEESTFNP